LSLLTALLQHGNAEIRGMALDKKQKKQLEAAKTRMQKLRQLLAGATDQPDDPQEIARLKREIAEVEAQMHKLHES
jgi:ribosomal protein L29